MVLSIWGVGLVIVLEWRFVCNVFMVCVVEWLMELVIVDNDGSIFGRLLLLGEFMVVD